MGNFATDLNRVQPVNERINTVATELKSQIDEATDGLGALVETVEKNQKSIEAAVADLAEKLGEAIKALAEKQAADNETVTEKHDELVARVGDQEDNLLALAKAALGFVPEVNPTKGKSKK